MLFVPEQVDLSDCPDVLELENLLCDPSSDPSARDFLDAESNVVLARVPGRLDVMGGIADYSGSLVCERPLANAVVLAAQPRQDDRIRVFSMGIEEQGLQPVFEGSLGELFDGAGPRPYSELKALFASCLCPWSGYLAGAIPVLARDAKMEFSNGFNMVVRSSIPLGSGISSSAALEMAAITALCAIQKTTIDGNEMARLGQRVENLVVGAPCGIMDQMVTTLGHKDRFLLIECRPGQIVGEASLPEGFDVAGINSSVKHRVGGSRYTDTRIAAFMGHRIILEEMRRRGLAGPENDPTEGYVTRVSPSEFSTDFSKKLPTSMTGSDFLAAYGGTVDSVTSVDPAKTYKVRSRTAHPIYENSRVRSFVSLLEDSGSPALPRMVKAGKLMYASHYSYRNNCGLDSPETLALVNIARSMGPEKGVFGAKITGGGAGGTVAILGASDRLDEAIAEIVENYKSATGLSPDIFRGSSPGALEFGHMRYRRA